MKRSVFSLAVLASLCIAVRPVQAGLLVNGDFENGNTGFSSDYTYSNATFITEGEYGVDTSTSSHNGYGDWALSHDHSTGNGFMMLVNGGPDSSARVWYETVAVQANTNYLFSFWGATMNTTSDSQSTLQVEVNGTAAGGTLLLPMNSPDNGGAWLQSAVAWNSGLNTTATFAILDTNTDGGWDDFAVDDIQLTAVPEPSSWMSLVSLACVVGTAFAIRRTKRRCADATSPSMNSPAW
jgi:hypothetical protein